jgi:hypothetical protein
MYEPWPERSHPPLWRVILAFAIAPAFAALLMAVFSAPTDTFESLWRTTFIIAVVGAYPPAIFFGIPAYLMLRRHFNARPVSCGIVGAVVAVMPWLLYVLVPSADWASVNGEATVIDGRYTAYGWLQSFEFLAFIGAFGLVAGMLFWAIAAAGYPPESA